MWKFGIVVSRMRDSPGLIQLSTAVQPYDLQSREPFSSSLWVSCVDVENRGFVQNYFRNEEYFLELRGLLANLIDRSTLWLMPPTQIGSSQVVHSAQFLGFSRSLRSELNLQLSTLELPHADIISNPHLISNVFSKVSSDETNTGHTLAPDMEYAVYQSQIFIPRFRPLALKKKLREISEAIPNPGTKRAELKIRQRVLLNTLYWQEKPDVTSIPDGYIEIEVHAVGLNTFDILSAKGVIRSETGTESLQFGCEAAGLVHRTGTGVKKLPVW
jgi:hypothetical protein